MKTSNKLPFSQIQRFLCFVKSIYKQLPNHLNKIFEARPPMRIKDINEINLITLLSEIFTATTLQSEKKSQDGTILSVAIIIIIILLILIIAVLMQVTDCFAYY